MLILILQLNEFWLFICLFVGLLSDVFDGIVARRIGVATTKLRRADTIVDSLFFTALLIAAWFTHPDLFQKYIVGLVILIGLKVVRMGFEYLKYRRETAYHMWSTKVWGNVHLFGDDDALAWGGDRVLFCVGNCDWYCDES